MVTKCKMNSFESVEYLARDTEHMANLSFSGSEFAKYFGNRSCFDSAAQ